MQYIGSFEVTTESIIITDPLSTIYKSGFFVTLAVPVKNGTWDAFVEKKHYISGSFGRDRKSIDWGIRNSKLLIKHESVNINGIKNADWEETGTVDVDGGMAGFFDNSIDIIKEDKGGNGQLIKELFKEEEDEDKDGVLLGRYGIAVSSGIGDGSYDVYSSSNGDCLKIVFDNDLVDD